MLIYDSSTAQPSLQPSNTSCLLGVNGERQIGGSGNRRWDALWPIFKWVFFFPKLFHCAFGSSSWVQKAAWIACSSKKAWGASERFWGGEVRRPRRLGECGRSFVFREEWRLNSCCPGFEPLLWCPVWEPEKGKNGLFHELKQEPSRTWPAACRVSILLWFASGALYRGPWSPETEKRVRGRHQGPHREK